ncbi:thioesterase family protein [Candidatus Berkiella aquae]|uniref:Thioesterase family protein n=1 Tax=Candidatus Berkiella aquae TaxID=295108 RepID=A0A0Q9YNX8_9GAMM|nr:thioesterase family protein [Candidatus Berkiella aquae]MCS5712128.1 thioesterase family protein [Candidatus Berkiella aquae]
MNLYLRLLWLLIRLPWLPKQADPLAASVLNMRVMPNDLDIYLHVNNGRYLTLMDLGRLHLMAVMGLLKPIQKSGFAPLLGSVKVHFIRSLRVFEKFKQTTQVIYWDEKWFYIEQKIFKGEELYVTALMKILFISKEGKVAPQRLFQLLPKPPTQPSLPPQVEHWIAAEKASR